MSPDKRNCNDLLLKSAVLQNSPHKIITHVQYLAETLGCAAKKDSPEQLDPVLVGEDPERGAVDEGLAILGIVKDLAG